MKWKAIHEKPTEGIPPMWFEYSAKQPERLREVELKTHDNKLYRGTVRGNLSPFKGATPKIVLKDYLGEYLIVSGIRIWRYV